MNFKERKSKSGRKINKISLFVLVNENNFSTFSWLPINATTIMRVEMKLRGIHIKRTYPSVNARDNKKIMWIYFFLNFPFLSLFLRNYRCVSASGFSSFFLSFNFFSSFFHLQNYTCFRIFFNYVTLWYIRWNILKIIISMNLLCFHLSLSKSINL